MIRLVEEREEDPEEERLRAMKEAEERQRILNAELAQRRIVEEAARAVALNNCVESNIGQSSFDTSKLPQAASMRYNVSSVQPAPAMPSMGVTFGSSTPKGNSGGFMQGGTSRPPRVPATGPPRGAGENDTHWRPTMRQPHMLDAMRLAPGVTLVEHGRSKVSEDRREANRMSRVDYFRFTGKSSRPSPLDTGDTQEADWPTFPSSPPQDAVDFFCQSGASMRGTSAPAAGSSAIPPPVEQLSPSRHQTMRHFDGHPRCESAMDTLDRSPMADATATSFSRTMRDPTAPPVGHRRMQRFHALGYCPHVRQRAPTMGMLRCGRPPLRFIGSQPPLGATMGHGLAIAGDDDRGFFFPAGSNGASLDSLQVPASRPAESPSRSARAARAGGKILADRDLKQRLFRSNI